MTISTGKPAKGFTRVVDKQALYARDTLLDWIQSRTYVCGSCQLSEFSFRSEDTKVLMRCMHCATDHVVDLFEAIAVPVAAL